MPSAFTSTIFSPRESSCALNSVMSAFLPSFFPCEGIEHEREREKRKVKSLLLSWRIQARNFGPLKYCYRVALRRLAELGRRGCFLLLLNHRAVLPEGSAGGGGGERWQKVGEHKLHNYRIPPEPGERSDTREGDREREISLGWACTGTARLRQWAERARLGHCPEPDQVPLGRTISEVRTGRVSAARRGAWRNSFLSYVTVDSIFEPTSNSDAFGFVSTIMIVYTRYVSLHRIGVGVRSKFCTGT